MSRKLIVGLGNPGARYQHNRHNIGFMAIDRLAADARISISRAKFKGVFGAGEIEGRSVVLLKPETYMNLSGESVSPARSFFDVDASDILVLHDELDLPFGRLRLKIGGGHAGHNGLRSLVAELGTAEFVRLRIGIGRPQKGSVTDYVLSDFAPGEEREWVPNTIERAADAARAVLREGPQRAMNEINATD